MQQSKIASWHNPRNFHLHASWCDLHDDLDGHEICNCVIGAAEQMDLLEKLSLAANQKAKTPQQIKRKRQAQKALNKLLDEITQVTERQNQLAHS